MPYSFWLVLASMSSLQVTETTAALAETEPMGAVPLMITTPILASKASSLVAGTVRLMLVTCARDTTDRNDTTIAMRMILDLHMVFASGDRVSRLFKEWGVPLLDEIRHILRTHRKLIGQLGNTRMWPFKLRSIGRQLRDAPSDWRRSSFAFPGLRRFDIFSCHSRPDRRGRNRCVTQRHWLLRSQCKPGFAIPENQAVPVRRRTEMRG